MSDSTGKNQMGSTPTKPAKSSSADYPVEEAERISQQQRLRKAAAAGAHALKSPLSSVLPRASVPASTAQSASGGASQTPPPAQDVSPQAAETATAAATDHVQATQRLETEEILAELRKLSAWTDHQRKMTKGSLVFLAILIPALLGVGLLMEHRVNGKPDQVAPSEKPDWYDVDRSVRAGDFDKAIAVGEELIQKTPQYPEAHRHLAAAYLAAGRIDKAREHYAEAFRLFPSEENEKLLNAVEKRSNAEKP